MTDRPSNHLPDHPNHHLIEVRGAGRRYGDVVALDDVQLRVAEGELVGLLGPNGAGKTTLLQLICGLRRPTSGTVRLAGRDPREAAARVGLGMTPQETGLPPTLTVGEVTRFVAGHFPAPRPPAEVLDRFGLAGLERRQTGGLSGGQKRRMAVALAFVGRPRVVLLDEPTTGLDVDARQDLWAAIREFHAGGGTVLLTSHYLEEIDALARRVVVIDRGRVLIDDTVEAVRSRVAVRRVSYRTGAGDRVEEMTEDADALVRGLVRSGADFQDLEVSRAGLEEAFLTLTRPARRPGHPSTQVAGTPGTVAAQEVSS